MNQKIVPLIDRVLVLPDETEKVTQGGILIPDTAQDKPLRGKVLSVGPGRTDDSGKLIPMSLKPDDRVAYGQHAGHQIEFEGTKYRIIRETDILGRIME